ncbi:hypothetical protein ACS0OT_07255 [Stenotrophomonas maltophilia group sp. RY12688]|uniref:hypothetical protein n=1 Tax=Stenotrophomonas maltophilia group sp. RY12688 TaxID=3454438 RepID=UPI003F962A33
MTTREAMAAIIAALTLADKFEAQADAAIEAAQIAQRRADRSALTPPEGYVVVTRNEAGQAVAVTRQDDDGRILSVIAELGPPEGYVLVPVELPDMGGAPNFTEGKYSRSNWHAAIADLQWLAARPEVP